MRRLIKLALLILVVLIILVATDNITINDEIKTKINSSLDYCYNWAKNTLNKN